MGNHSTPQRLEGYDAVVAREAMEEPHPLAPLRVTLDGTRQRRQALTPVLHAKARQDPAADAWDVLTRVPCQCHNAPSSAVRTDPSGPMLALSMRLSAYGGGFVRPTCRTG